MNRSSLVRLYPARWRARYQDEFAAMLDDERLTPCLIADLLKGAVAAHMSPYPPAEELTMTRPRVQLAAALLATLAVFPAAVFFASAIARGMQPVEHQPSATFNAIVEAFKSFPAGVNVALLLVGPAVALVLALAVLITRLPADMELRADIAEFGTVSLRLLRRPAVVLSALVVLASFCTLFFLLVHSIVG